LSGRYDKSDKGWNNKMARFLHCADWQIGRQFASFNPENAHPLADARLAVVERLARLATEHGVDAVLVAGDVFDAQTVSDRTIRRLFNALAGFAGPWILIPGNHDAALAESVWTRARRLAAVPANACISLQPEVLDFTALGFAVLTAPLTARHTFGDLTDWFDRADTAAGLVRIGLAHGCVQGILAEGIDSANPIAPDRASRARLDYLALGDWHGNKRIDARTWYSGTPEPDRFKANDAGRALLVDIASPGAEPVVTVLDTAHYRWQTVAVTLQVDSDVDELVQRLAACHDTDVVDLAVAGRVDLAGHQRLQAAIGLAEARTRHLGVDLTELHLAPTEDDIAGLHADGYLGDVIAELRAAQSIGGDEAAQTAQDALAILAAALVQRAPAPVAGQGAGA
jgi:DNA repair exonuclease SbcCD nuclease subunit